MHCNNELDQSRNLCCNEVYHVLKSYIRNYGAQEGLLCADHLQLSETIFGYELCCNYDYQKQFKNGYRMWHCTPPEWCRDFCEPPDAPP